MVAVFTDRVNLSEQFEDCLGYTPQFSGLDQLYDEFYESGFAVLDSSNDFAGRIEIARLYVDSTFLSLGIARPVSVPGARYQQLEFGEQR